ncbi:MAG: metal ABC transporter substrate-binding protein, partial [Clostridia bacterium]
EEEHVHDETCDHDHEEEHECDETCDHDHEVDEHIWLSITNAIKVCQEISNIFAGIDTENKANFELNFENYKVELLQLDTLYKEVVAEAKSDTLIFGDRFPFAYFVKDYNLNYFSAFSSCTAETEASFETILLLTEKINELNVSAVLTIENPQHKIAETLVENSNYKDTQILVLHSLQGITTAEINNGLTYLSVMTENLEVIKEALN